jgi:hypothetical protein
MFNLFKKSVQCSNMVAVKHRDKHQKINLEIIDNVKM